MTISTEPTSPAAMPGPPTNETSGPPSSGVDFSTRFAARFLDIVVDLRRGSPTFGAWEGFALDDEQMRQLYIPVGFGHGFCVTSEIADVAYKCSSYYDPATESGIRDDDPAIAIDWPHEIG